MALLLSQTCDLQTQQPNEDKPWIIYDRFIPYSLRDFLVVLCSLIASTSPAQKFRRVSWKIRKNLNLRLANKASFHILHLLKISKKNAVISPSFWSHIDKVYLARLQLLALQKIPVNWMSFVSPGVLLSSGCLWHQAEMVISMKAHGGPLHLPWLPPSQHSGCWNQALNPQPGAGLQTYPVLMYFGLIARAEKAEVKWKVIRTIIWGSFVSRGHKSFLYSSPKEYNLVIILWQWHLWERLERSRRKKQAKGRCFLAGCMHQSWHAPETLPKLPSNKRLGVT